MIEGDEADHAAFYREYAKYECLGHFGGYIRSRLNDFIGYAEDVEDGIDQESDDLMINLGNNNDMSHSGFGRWKAEPGGKINNWQNCAAEVDDPADKAWRLW